MTSVTPRSSWPAAEGMNPAAANDSQRMPVAGNAMTQNVNQNNRSFSMMNNAPRMNAPIPPQPDLASQLNAQGQGNMKALMQQQQQQQHQQHQQHRHAGNAQSAPLFSPNNASVNMHSVQQVHQGNIFVNGQSDLNHSQTFSGLPNAGVQQQQQQHGLSHNNAVKNETHTGNSFLNATNEFASRIDNANAMAEFDMNQKRDSVQMSNLANDSIFNALQPHTQPQSAQQQPPPPSSSSSLSDVKPLHPSISSPAMSMPVSGGKPKSHSAAMAQVRNASSWSSLAGSSQQGQGGSSGKSSNLVDSFQQFKRQAKEKEARQKMLIEQQEMKRQQKEQAERERMRVEAERRREREEEEALEKARCVVFASLFPSAMLTMFALCSPGGWLWA